MGLLRCSIRGFRLLLFMRGEFLMPKNVKIISLIFCLSLLFFAGIASANDIFKKYADKDEETLMKDLAALSKKQLIEEMDSLAKSSEGTGDINALIPFATELFERKDEISDEELLTYIKNPSLSPATRDFFVELYVAKHEDGNNLDEIKALLADPEVDKSTKTSIVTTAHFSPDDVGILIKLAKSDNGLLAFHSIKVLNSLDKNAANQLAEEILSNLNQSSKIELEAALKSKAIFLKTAKEKDQNYENLEKQFIQLNLDILKNSNDPELKDTAVFALSDLGSKNALKTILKSEFIDRELKVFAVDQNFMTLKRILENHPTREELNLVIQAMDILPITDLAEPLKHIAGKVKELDFKKKIEETIANIEKNGIKGNEKWLDHAQ